MRMLEDTNKESIMAVLVVDVCMLPERYRVFTASLQDRVTNVHIVGLGLWHSACRRFGTCCLHVHRRKYCDPENSGRNRILNIISKT